MNSNTNRLFSLCLVALLVALAACEPRSAEYLLAEQTRAVAQATYAAASNRQQIALATAEAAVEAERDFMEQIEQDAGQLMLLGLMVIGVLFVGGILIVAAMSPFAKQELKRETDRLLQIEIPQQRLRNYKASVDLQLVQMQQSAPQPAASRVTTPPPDSVAMPAPLSPTRTQYPEETTAAYPARQPRTPSSRMPPATPHSDDGGMTQPSKPQDIPEL